MASMKDIQAEINNALRAIEDADESVNVEELEESINSYLDELAGQEAEKVDAYAYVIREQSARIDFLSAEKKRIDAKLAAAKNGLDRTKSFMVLVLSGAGLKKISGNESTLSIRNTEAVNVIVDAESLPEDLRTVKTTYAADKKAIKEAIKSGRVIDGCSIVENTSLVVR